tara:strand:- start:685 stop:1293 length:609 start_codon:yes stop_codon:yes gene_type:complete
MASKRKYERITTPVGVASYPWLKDADYKFDKEKGIYSCNIYVDDAEAKDLISVIDKSYTENLAEQKKLNKGKTIKPGPKPYISENGKTLFKIKMKGKIGDVEIRPVVIDSSGQPMTDIVVYGGSKVKVSADLVPYYVATTGAGISLRLVGVQVLELQTKPMPSMANLGFKEEKGYVHAANEDIEEQPSKPAQTNETSKEDFI